MLKSLTPMEMAKILVVDDEPSILRLLQEALTQWGYQVKCASSGTDAIEAVRGEMFDAVLTDIRMPEMSGLELLKEIKRHDESIEIVMMTGYPTITSAVDALGNSGPMQRVKEIIAKVAPTSSPVLIEGESGTGKELVAAAIHRLSPRAKGPFVPVNCSAIPADLLESEFFGHVRGAFSGAVSDTVGLFRGANDGTIFLDEIVELSPALQVKLLRVLQEMQVRPVGSTKAYVVDVRVIAATNRDLDRAIAEEKFRQDLYYRLNVVRVSLPPLRARREDVQALANYFIRRFNRRFRRELRGITPEAVTALQGYDFPGNVRELENLLERAYAMGAREQITLADLPSLASDRVLSAAPMSGGGAIPQLAEVEKELILRALAFYKGPIDAHPDEMLHLVAGRYFQTHWLPPPVGAPETAESYSRWGFSYLDLGDVVYWLLGKAAAAGALFGVTPAVAMRSVQVVLYVVLFVWCLARARTFVPALGFLLLTPQLWYVFSYINSDALPFLLFTGLILELGWPESGIRAFWRSREAGPTAGVFAVGVLLGLLLISKLNYLVSVVFLGGILVWLRGEITHWKRLTVPIAVAIAIAAPWSCYHAWVNDFQTSTKVAALRARGVPVSDLVTTLDWPGLSFRSFSGLYGWMSIVAVPWVYYAFGALDAALLAILALPVAVRRARSTQLLFLGVLACAALVVAQSLYRSWVVNFQGQGRYLFPILPMFFFYWRQCEARAFRTAALLVTALLGTLSLFSFALIGLANLT